MIAARPLRLAADGRLAEAGLLADTRLQRLLGVLGRDGEAARVVGGAVRNALLGVPVADVDVATTAEPDVVIRRVQAARWRAVPTGLAHGTVTVLVDGAAFEVTTLRRDVETDGRHAVVRFSRDFDEDALRRDFTINALSVEAGGLVHDPAGGLADLAAGRVRFIGDADQRLVEDALRLLRFFRFHAAYGLGPLDPAGLAATLRHRAALDRLSRERVRGEVLKLLTAGGAVAVLRAMDDTGVLAAALGGPADPTRFDRLAALEHRQALEPDALLRLAALAAPDLAGALHLRDALRLSNTEARRIAAGVEARGSLDPARPLDRAGCLALLLATGRAPAQDAVMLAAAEAEPSSLAAWERSLAMVRTETSPVLPIGGDAVMARGVAGGRRVGAVLKRFQAAWIRAGFPGDPASLATLLDAAIAADRSG